MNKKEKVPNAVFKETMEVVWYKASDVLPRRLRCRKSEGCDLSHACYAIHIDKDYHEGAVIHDDVRYDFDANRWIWDDGGDMMHPIGIPNPTYWAYMTWPEGPSIDIKEELRDGE